MSKILKDFKKSTTKIKIESGKTCLVACKKQTELL